jgi:hypothetical protein
MVDTNYIIWVIIKDLYNENGWRLESHSMSEIVKVKERMKKRKEKRKRWIYKNWGLDLGFFLGYVVIWCDGKVMPSNIFKVWWCNKLISYGYTWRVQMFLAKAHKQPAAQQTNNK